MPSITRPPALDHPHPADNSTAAALMLRRVAAAG